MALPTQTIEFKAGKDTYNFPTPSPRVPHPRSATMQVSPARSPLDPALGDSPKIGVAIGSPREMPPQWSRTHTVDHLAKQLPARPPPTRAMTELPQIPEKAAEQTAKKKGSWKKLGGIFGRKPSAKATAPEPFYKVRPPQEQGERHPQQQMRSLHSAAKQQALPSPAASSGDDRSPLPAASGHRRTPSMTRGMARLEARAQADRAAFMEQEQKEQPPAPRVIRTPSMIQREGLSPTFGSPGASRTSEEIFKSMEAASGKRNDSPLSVTDGPRTLRLDLDIPDHHMERYSVMFEKFLVNGNDKGPSIIERRQSKLQKKRSLKRLDEIDRRNHIETPQIPQRSATSPHLSKMPSLSITTGKKVRSPKPSPAHEPEPPTTAVHRPQPIKRANTAPMKTGSPVKQNFSKPRMIMVTEPVVKSPVEQTHTRQGSMYSENSLPPTPTSDRPSLDDRALCPVPSISKHAADDSGTWEMLTANPNTTAIPKRQASLRRQEPDPYRRVKSPEDLESRVVQVSVARQVSVSKARKQVRQAVEVKQPLRPRVVELSKNRKSTVVLIEGGEE